MANSRDPLEGLRAVFGTGISPEQYIDIIPGVCLLPLYDSLSTLDRHNAILWLLSANSPWIKPSVTEPKVSVGRQRVLALALETRQKHSVNLRSISVVWIHYALLLVCLSEVTNEYMNTLPRFLL